MFDDPNFLIEFLVLSLATSRIALMVTVESLPYNIGNKIRYLLGVRYLKFEAIENEPAIYYTAEEVKDIKDDGRIKEITMVHLYWFSEIFSCYWCASVWISGLLIILKIISFRPYFLIILIPAVSMISILIKEKGLGE